VLAAYAWRDTPAGTPPAVTSRRTFLAGWLGVGRIAIGMARQKLRPPVHLLRRRGLAGDVLPGGPGHSVTSPDGSAWEREFVDRGAGEEWGGLLRQGAEAAG
jgi:hypothetical protein